MCYIKVNDIKRPYAAAANTPIATQYNNSIYGNRKGISGLRRHHTRRFYFYINKATPSAAASATTALPGTALAPIPSSYGVLSSPLSDAT